MPVFARLPDAEENDEPGKFEFENRWETHGYTRQELYDIAGLGLLVPAPAIADLRTGFLAKMACYALVPQYIGPAPLVKLATRCVNETDNHYLFTVGYSAGARSQNAFNEESQAPATAAEVARPSVRVTADRVRVLVANGDIRVYEKTGTTAPAAPRGILPDANGNFRGVDKVVPTTSWTESHVLAEGAFSLAVAEGVVGKVNSAPFRGKAARTVLCVGVSADQRAEGKWDVSAEFQYSAKLEGKAPGFADFEDVLKEGWDFMFPLEEGGETVALCVAPLYEEANWPALIPSLGDPAP